MTDTFPSQPDTAPEKVPGGFIYESEHPQLQIPFSVRMEGRKLEGKTLSITEALVSGLVPPNGEMQGNTVALLFDFEGFTLTLFLVADIEKIGESDNPDYRLRFCDPTASHLGPLRHILNSHLAGDLVTVDRFLGYVGPTKVTTKAPKAPPSLAERAGQAGRKVAIFGLSIGLIAMAANIVHYRIIFTYEPRPVIVSQGGETLRATSAGQITYTNESASAGDVVYSIGANSGNLISVRMPCDCEIEPLSDFYDGATVLAGAPLVKLIDPDAGFEVGTLISFEGAARLMSGDTAELELTDGRIVPVDITLPETSETAQAIDMIAAEIAVSNDNRDQIAVGENARLRFRRDLLPEVLKTTLNNTWSRAKSFFAES